MMGAAANAAEILTVTIESRGIMRRTAARIGIVAALALSMGVATATSPMRATLRRMVPRLSVVGLASTTMYPSELSCFSLSLATI